MAEGVSSIVSLAAIAGYPRYRRNEEFHAALQACDMLIDTQEVQRFRQGGRRCINSLLLIDVFA